MWAVGRLSLLARGLDAGVRAPEISTPVVEPVAAPIAEGEPEAAPLTVPGNLPEVTAAARSIEPIEPTRAVETVEIVEAVTVVPPATFVTEAEVETIEARVEPEVERDPDLAPSLPFVEAVVSPEPEPEPTIETPKLPEPILAEPTVTEPVVAETLAAAVSEPPDQLDVAAEPDPPRQTPKPKVARVRPIPLAAPQITPPVEVSVEPKPEPAPAPASTTTLEEAAPEVHVTPAAAAPPTEHQAATHEGPRERLSEAAIDPPPATITHVSPPAERTVILPPAPQVEATPPAPPVQSLPPLSPQKAERVEIAPAPSFFQRIVIRVKSFFRSLFG